MTNTVLGQGRLYYFLNFRKNYGVPGKGIGEKKRERERQREREREREFECDFIFELQRLQIRQDASFH